MLTISKPRSGGQARTYHALEFAAKEANYWSREQQGHSEWQGKLAQEWGLQGSVGSEQFARLTEGQHPDTQEQMVRHQPAKTYENQFGRDSRIVGDLEPNRFAIDEIWPDCSYGNFSGFAGNTRIGIYTRKSYLSFCLSRGEQKDPQSLTIRPKRSSISVLNCFMNPPSCEPNEVAASIYPLRLQTKVHQTFILTPSM